jgi:hypothetical protein
VTDSQPESSSAVATGGAGTFFEQNVDAVFLALLLVRGIPPVLTDCQVTEVRFQTNPDWHTDDFLLIGVTPAGSRRRLIGQVKLGLEIGANDDFVEVIVDSWRDFKGSQFVADTDCFAIVTLRGTNMLLTHFVGLLDAARAAKDEDDFATRLASLSKKVNCYHGTVCEIIRGVEAGATPHDVWRYLRALHVVNFDLTSSTGQTEAMMKSHLAFTASGQDRLGTATRTWQALLVQAARGMTTKGTFQLEDLPAELRAAHTPTPGRDQEILRALVQHSEFVLAEIRSDVAGVQAPRTQLVSSILQVLGESQIVVVTGPSGVGKSALAKMVVGSLERDQFVFAFRAERFAASHIDDALKAAGLPTSEELRAVLAAQPRKILLIESGEKLLEASTRGAFADLVRLVCRDPSWQLLITCRDYSVDALRASHLDDSRVAIGVVAVPPFDHSERDGITKGNEGLSRLAAAPALRDLLRNPFVLRMASRMTWPPGQALPDSERSFRARFWREVVRAESHQGEGFPARREQSLVEIALRRARALTPFVSCTGLDLAAVARIKNDSLISTSPKSELLAAPAHDVLEDWALLQWLEARAEEHAHSLTNIAAAVGDYPAIRRTYRRFLLDLVREDIGQANHYFESACAPGSALPRRFQDDTLVALLQSEHVQVLLDRHQERLLAEKDLLRRLIFLTRVACVGSPVWMADAPPIAMLVPRGASWTALLALIARGLDSFAERDAGLLLGLIEDWAKGVSLWTPSPDGAKEATQIGHRLLRWFGGYSHDDDMERTLKVIARVPLADPGQLASLLRLEDRPARRDRDETEPFEIDDIPSDPQEDDDGA